MDSRVGGLPDLTGVYEHSVSGQLNLNTTLGAFKIDGAALGTGTAGNDDGPDYMRITRGSVNVLNTSYNSVDLRAHIYSSALNGMDIGPDPALLPNRSTIRIGPDQLEFLRQDRTILSGSPGFFLWTSELTMSAAIPFLQRSFGGFIDLGGTFQFAASASPFGMGNALLHRAIWKNASGVVADLGPSFLFANNAIYQADGATIISSQARIFFDNAAYNVINGGIGTQGAAVGHATLYSNLTVGAGWTIALRCGVFIQDAIVDGTLDDQVGFIVPDLDAAATNTAIRSLMLAGAGKFFIEHLGTALSLFGGDVEIDGAFNHDGSTYGQYGATPVAQDTGWLISNVSTLRAYDANSTNTDEIADTLGTLVEIVLKLQGVVGA